MSRKFFSSKRIKLTATLAVCALLIFFNPRGFFDPLRGLFFRISYPFQKTFYLLSADIRGAANFLGSISDLKKENENLIKENNALSSEAALLKDEKKENEILREQLNLSSRKKFNSEASFVIGLDPQKFGSWIIIDKGTSSGLAPNMPVIASEGILIGKIAEVYANAAKVNLLTESSSVTNALDAETGARGVVRGEYGLGIVLDMVAQTDALNPGDTVITSGLGGDLPKGLLIGKVQEIGVSPDKLFQQAVIMPQVGYSNLNVVFVVKNK